MKSVKSADFSMDYSALESLVSEVNSLNEDFKKMCAELDSLARSLEGIWQGKAQAEFVASYNRLRPKLDSISVILKKYSDEITKAANNEIGLESQSGNLMNLIAFPSF